MPQYSAAYGMGNSFLCPVLTHWGRDKISAIWQTPYWNGFSWMKIYELRLKYQLKFVPIPECPINNIPALVEIMAWRRPGDKPLSELMMDSLLTHLSLIKFGHRPFRYSWTRWALCVVFVPWYGSILHIFFRVSSLALRWSYCHSVSEVTLWNISK